MAELYGCLIEASPAWLGPWAAGSNVATLPFDVQQLMFIEEFLDPNEIKKHFQSVKMPVIQLIFWYFLRMIGSYSLRLQVCIWLKSDQPLTADQDPLPLEHQEVLPILAP